MARAPELRSTRLPEPAVRGEYVVNVFDEHGALVCWCGPYDLRAWRDCIHLFADAGWSEMDRPYHYSRLGREAA